MHHYMTGREGELSPQAVHAFDQAFSSRQRELQQQLQATKAANRNTDEQVSPISTSVPAAPPCLHPLTVQQLTSSAVFPVPVTFHSWS